MVGKNNNIKMIQTNLKKHYKAYKVGKRWLYASLASFALGAGLLLGGNATAYADTTTQNDTTPVESTNVASTKSSSAASSTDTNKVSLQTANKTTDNTDTAAKSATNSNLSTMPKAAATNNGQTVKVQTPNTNKIQTPAPQTKVQAPKAVTAPTTNTKAVTNTPKTQTADSVTKSIPAPQTPTTKTLVDPTNAQLKAAQASAAQVYAATLKPQKVVAIGDPTADATLTISATAVGYGTNATDPLTLKLNINAKAGDTAVINIPAKTGVYSFKSADPLIGGAGNTDVKRNDDGTYTVTDSFTTDSKTSQLIKLNLNNNGLGQDNPMDDVGKEVTKTVTYTINNGPTSSVKFTQLIKPTTKLSTVSLLYPNPGTVSTLLPNKNYVFTMGVNEADGVQDDSWKSARVNSADNYSGSKVTIPVPDGFILDTDNTSKINAFKDASTITQPGGKGTDVIINVPAKSGSQGWEEVPPYKIVGAFDVAQTSTNQTLTANGDVTFSQVMNSDGDVLTDKADPWSVVLLANNGGSDIGKSAAVATIKGNSSGTSDKLVLDTDTSNDPQYLNSFGFAFNSADEANNANIQITMPDGLDATSIKTPTSIVSPSVYLPDTTSYSYTLTLADGTTETGTVNAGDKVTPTDSAAIRTAVFVPNKIAPGANTNDLGNASSFIAYGHLSSTYDNGTAVQDNDQLVSSITVSFEANGTPLTKKVDATQTVTEAVSKAVGYVYQSSTKPGNQNSGYLSLKSSSGQTGYNIYEPTFYFVVPKATTVTSTSHPDGAKISEFTANDGHMVVKFDYTGSGITVDTSKPTNTYGQVFLANNPDALPGHYPFYMYVVSPKNKIANDTPATDSTYVQNNPKAFLMADGSGKWDIDTASSLFTTTLAKGNLDTAPQLDGTNDNHDGSNLTFYDSIVYTSLEDNAKNNNAGVAINLPTIGDSKGSQYTFKLSHAIDMPKDYTTVDGNGTAINPVILYSTQPQKVTTGVATPDTSTYVTADKVTDWSKIQSVVIQINGIKPNTSTGRIALNGTVDQINQQTDKTGYLQTIFYGNGTPASVISKDASIKIIGTSIINTRYHYVDGSGANHYIVLKDLSKNLKDNVDTFTNDYPTKLADFSDADQDLIPTGYKLNTDVSGKITPTIIDGTGNGAAQFGQKVQGAYDGDFVQYELVGNKVSAVVEYVDDDNNGAVVGPSTTLTGVTDGTANWDTTNKIPANYVLAKGQAAKGNYTFTTALNQIIPVHLVHQLVPGTATTTRTITYVIANGDKSKTPSPKVQTMNWKTVTDKVTGASYAAPLNDYVAVPNPPVAGYTAHTPNNVVPELSAGPMLTSQLSQLNLNRTVIYTADKQTVSITYTNTKTGEPINTVIVTGNTDEPINVPGLRGYTIDKTGVPTSFEPGVTQANVPATPDDTDTTTAPDEPDTTVPPVTPQTSDNTPTPEVTDTPVTSTSEGTVVPSTDNTPQKGQDGDTTTDSTDHGQVVPDSTTSGETDETKVAQPQATVGYASVAQKTAVTAKQSNVIGQANATDQTNGVKTGQAKLPQTGEPNNQAATLSLLGLMTGMLSLFGLKRRKRNDD